MFGKKKDKPSGDKAPSGDDALRQSFADAKEATRRATFLYMAAIQPAAGKELAGPYKAAFDACRTNMLSIGERLGVSAAEIDAELSATCDADADRLARGSQAEAETYTRESGAIVQRFLAAVKVSAPN
jgi:hypothetical protein